MSSTAQFLEDVVAPLSPLVCAVGLALLLGMIRRRRDARRLRERVARAKANITADGVVEGPKGPYVPHKRWDVGLGARTPSESKPIKQPGYHGTLWP